MTRKLLALVLLVSVIATSYGIGPVLAASIETSSTVPAVQTSVSSDIQIDDTRANAGDAADFFQFSMR